MTDKIEGGLTELIGIQGADFIAGTNNFYPEEGPPRATHVVDFQLEQHPVTKAQFSAFVEATGYITTAERTPEPADYPSVDPALLVAGSLVFTPTSGPVDLRDWSQWWRFQPGVSWRDTRDDDHPVVHVSFKDAQAYATWAGRRLPTEDELEYAMRAGRPATVYAWSDEYAPNQQLQANTYQGRFPYDNKGAKGATGIWHGTSPVGDFGTNPWGFADLIGNTWEWTTTLYGTGPQREQFQAAATCCAPEAEWQAARRQATSVGERYPRRVVKGGSHLCAPEYCHRYRPQARQGQTEDSSTSHIGFRCAV